MIMAVIVYAPIAPIILPIGLTTFGCFWIVYRYGFLYLKARQVQTGGLLYLKALFQLFIGMYTMELCVLGLFLLARDADGNFACIPHSVIMGCVLALTAIIHHLLRRKFLPLALSSIQDVDVSERGSEDRCKGMVIKAAMPTLQDVWLPKDEYGICDNEIIWLKEIAPGLSVTNECAAIAKGGALKCSRPIEAAEEQIS